MDGSSCTQRENLGKRCYGWHKVPQDAVLAVTAHAALGWTFCSLGALRAARLHLEAAIAPSTPDQRHAPVLRLSQDRVVASRTHAAVTLWFLGYPEQARTHLHDALALAHELAHPFSLALARWSAAWVGAVRRDVPAVYEHSRGCRRTEP